MTATRLDGKACATALEEHLKERISKCETQPHLAVIIVGDDPASHVYVRNKIKCFVRIKICHHSKKIFNNYTKEFTFSHHMFLTNFIFSNIR